MPTPKTIIIAFHTSRSCWGGHGAQQKGCSLQKSTFQRKESLPKVPISEEIAALMQMAHPHNNTTLMNTNKSRVRWEGARYAKPLLTRWRGVIIKGERGWRRVVIPQDHIRRFVAVYNYGTVTHALTGLGGWERGLRFYKTLGIIYYFLCSRTIELRFWFMDLQMFRVKRVRHYGVQALNI